MKAQSEIISAVVIVIISMSLFGSAYLWGWPILEKKRDEEKVRRVFDDYFDPTNPNSVVGIIEEVKRDKSSKIVSGSEEGAWNVTNGSIIFYKVFRVSPFPSDGKWVFIDGNAAGIGDINVDPWYAIYGRSESYEDGYMVYYNLTTVNLTDSTGKIFRIEFSPDKNSFYGKSLIFQYNTEVINPSDPNYIIISIKVYPV